MLSRLWLGFDGLENNMVLKLVIDAMGQLWRLWYFKDGGDFCGDIAKIFAVILWKFSRHTRFFFIFVVPLQIYSRHTHGVCFFLPDAKFYNFFFCFSITPKSPILWGVVGSRLAKWMLAPQVTHIYFDVYIRTTARIGRGRRTGGWIV